MLAPISFQTSSERSVAGVTLSKQCCQCITTRAMGRLKPALNASNVHIKCADTSGDIHMYGIITNPYYHTGARLAKPGDIAI